MKSFVFIIMIICSLSAKATLEQDLINKRIVLKTTLTYLIEGGKFTEAESVLKKYLKKNKNDSEALRLSGLVHYMKGDFFKAGDFFHEAGKYSEGDQKAINIYLLAQSHLKENRYSKAEKDLEQLREIDISRDYADNALKELREKKSIPELNTAILLKSKLELISRQEAKQPEVKEAPKKYALKLSLVTGHDSNPIFIPDGSQTQNDAASMVMSTTASGTYQSTLGGGDFSNKFDLGYSKFQEVIAESFNNLRMALTTQWKPQQEFFRKNKLKLTNKLERSYQAQDELLYYYTSDNVDFNKEFEPFRNNKFNLSTLVGYRAYNNEELDSQENNRNGASFGLRGIHKYGFESWATINSLQLGMQKTSGKKFNTNSAAFVTNIQKTTYFDLEASLNLSYSITDYPEFTEKRSDKMFGYGLDISRAIERVKGLNLKLSYSIINNKSDVSDSTYSQKVASFWIDYEAF